MKLRSLDLFSGIGGFSHALRSIAHTIGYCDINVNCGEVLQKHMDMGHLHKAPIFTDVTKLTAKDVVRTRPNMITAGFPCQDISLANPNGLGLKGDKSGLFYEIVRLVDELDDKINIIFLENSSHTVDAGFDSIKREMEKRGFIVKYTLIRASDIGALHNRYRWYCLCVHSRVVDKRLPLIPKDDLQFSWMKSMKLPKIIEITSKDMKEKNLVRCKMLGNSIVPQCAMHAWNALVADKSNNVYTPFAFVKRSSLSLKFTDGQNKIVKRHWATPVFSIWHNYRSLTDRGSRLLSNQVYYYNLTHIREGDKHKKEWSHKYMAHPEFVESLMGYPRGWTKV